MDKILIAGGVGFIGSHLADELLKRNNKVICVDNLYTGSKDNIKHLIDNKNFKFIEQDITEDLDIKVDKIYNLACPASPRYYQKTPIKTLMTSVTGSYNLLNLAKKYDAEILQASTSEVYGNPIKSPQTETYNGNVNQLGKRGCYDEGKRCAETLFMDFNREYNIDTKVARIFNTYGPRLNKNDGRVVSNFIIQALNNNDITIYGSGLQTRSFCYIEDTVNGLIRLMNSNINTPVNIGNTHEITIFKLAKIIKNLTSSKSEIVYRELPENDPEQRQPDITKAKNKLNWKPRIKLEEGLLQTIEYFKELINYGISMA